MKERPILFSGEMVRAILDGRKTQTRRVLNPQLTRWDFVNKGLFYSLEKAHKNIKCSSAGPFDIIEKAMLFFAQRHSPYGVPGDRLWVRETFRVWHDLDRPVMQTHYRADRPQNTDGYRWRPSIHMPRWASRITLEVTGVRVERVQDISEEDAKAEGVDPAPFCKAGRPPGMEHVEAFELLWDRINAKRNDGQYAWKRNPWVWVVEFRKL